MKFAEGISELIAREYPPLQEVVLYARKTDQQDELTRALFREPQ